MSCLQRGGWREGTTRVLLDLCADTTSTQPSCQSKAVLAGTPTHQNHTWNIHYPACILPAPLGRAYRVLGTMQFLQWQRVEYAVHAALGTECRRSDESATEWTLLMQAEPDTGGVPRGCVYVGAWGSGCSHRSHASVNERNHRLPLSAIKLERMCDMCRFWGEYLPSTLLHVWNLVCHPMSNSS